jgi:hypothetical protein
VSSLHLGKEYEVTAQGVYIQVNVEIRAFRLHQMIDRKRLSIGQEVFQIHPDSNSAPAIN